jgi:hypothetical protein
MQAVPMCVIDRRAYGSMYSSNSSVPSWSMAFAQPRWTTGDYQSAAARSMTARLAFTTRPAGPEPGFDPLALIAALNSTGVPYIVIGGLAAVLHGSPRPTADLDLMVLEIHDRLHPIARILRELSAVPYDRLGTTADINPDWLRRRPTFPLLEFHTSMGGIDLDDYGTATYRDVEQRSVEVGLGKQSVRFAGLDDLIALKQSAGRPQDHADIAILESVRGYLAVS